MQIPHHQLPAATLRAIVAEFVSRDGTDHSSLEQRIESVLHQLDVGSVRLHFEAETQTCNIVPWDEERTRPAGG